MAATVTGTFQLIDRASRPLQKIRMEAEKTDRAIADLGDRLDDIGTSNQLSQFEDVGRQLRDVGRNADAAGGEIDVMESAVNRLDGTTQRAGRSMGRMGGRMRLLALAIGALLPVIVDLSGALGALVGSLGQAIVGVGALATGLGGALLVGLAGIAGAAIPATKRIKELKEEFTNFKNSWKTMTAPGQKDFLQMLRESMESIGKMMPMLADSSNRSMAAARAAVAGFFDRLDSPNFGKFVERMTTSFERIAGPLAQSIANIGEALGNIARASAPYVEQMIKAFENMTGNWADSTANTAKLRQSIGQAVVQARDWLHLLDAIWELTKATFGSGADEGQGLVRDMTRRLNEYTEWVTRNPDKMNAFWRDSILGTKELARFLSSLRLPLKNLNDAMEPIVRLFEQLVGALARLKIPGTEISGLTGAVAAYGGMKVAGAGGIWGIRGPAAAGSASNPIATVNMNERGGGMPTPVGGGRGGGGGGGGRSGGGGGVFGRIGRGVRGIPKAGLLGGALALLLAGDAFNRTEGNFGNRTANAAAALDPLTMLEMLGIDSPITEVNPRTGLRNIRTGIDFSNPASFAALLNPLTMGTMAFVGLRGLFDDDGGANRPQRGPGQRARALREDIARNQSRSAANQTGVPEARVRRAQEYTNAKTVENFRDTTKAVGIETKKAENLAAKHFKQARKAMVAESDKAGFEVAGSYRRLQQQVYAQLNKFMSPSEARRAMTGAGIGAPSSGGSRSSGSSGRPNPNGTLMPYAGGGRIGGIGNRDTVPLMGMAAPGELIVNRHTEGRVNSMLGAFGTSLDSEVGRERVPHSGTPKPGESGFKENAAMGMRVPMFRRGGRTRTSAGGSANSILAAGRLGSQMGLNVAEGPGYGGIPSGGHAPNSLHYQGLAYDLSGPPALMRRYFHAALRSFRSSINELFYDPIGYYIDGGARVPGAIGGHSDHVHIGFNSGGARGAVRLPRGARDPRIRVRAPRTALSGIPGAASQRGMNMLAGGMQGAMNGTRGRAAGPGQIMGASVFGGPNDPATGTIGYRGDSLPGRMAFAELNMGTAMGGLPYKAPVRVSLGNRSVIARKLDIGAGGGPVGGVPRAIDLWHETAAALGMKGGLAKVKVARLAQGGRVPFGGWFGNGGDFIADKPTMIGVGESGKERVTVTPAGKTSGREVKIGAINIQNHREGDIRKQVKREIKQAFDDLERELGNTSGNGIV